ncbi:hypothetical protein DL93DRAFT_2092349 [Clavulina sp. PMI_390]|nr:hypothetical protein DL93DRAFT_2092349 [Clavulina sp. PMI_390]
MDQCSSTHNPIFLWHLCTTEADFCAIKAALTRLCPIAPELGDFAQWKERFGGSPRAALSIHPIQESSVLVTGLDDSGSELSDPDERDSRIKLAGSPMPQRPVKAVRELMQATVDHLLLPAHEEDTKVDLANDINLIFIPARGRSNQQKAGYGAQYQLIKGVDVLPDACPKTASSSILRVGDLYIMKTKQGETRAWAFNRSIVEAPGWWAQISQHDQHPFLHGLFLELPFGSDIPVWRSFQTIRERKAKAEGSKMAEGSKGGR